MTGTPKLLGLYVQPDHAERDTEGRLSLLVGFAVEVIEVTNCEKPQGAGGHVFEGRTFGLGRREMQHTPPYSTPSREAMRRWWELEPYCAPVPEELLEGEKATSLKEERHLVG
jgi:hypothetical protein